MVHFTKPQISKSDLQVIKKRKNDHPDKKVRLRLNILWCSTICDNVPTVAKIVGVCDRQVFNIISMYNKYGLTEVMQINYYKPESKLDAFSDLIQKEFEQEPPASIRDARDKIRKMTGIKRSHTQVRKFLKKLGMKLLKPGLVPMAKDETNIEDKTIKQREYVKNKLAPVLKEDSKGERKVLFMDACHIQLACLLGFIWCFAKKYIRSLPLRGRVNIIGACSGHGNDIICDIIQETVDQNSIAYFLFKVRSTIKEGKITIVLDNAQYHKTAHVFKTADDLGIELLFLPVASPNLNIIERLWKFTKKKFVANNVFQSLDDLQKHLKKSFSGLKNKYKSDLCSLLTLNFQYFDGTMQFLAA